MLMQFKLPKDDDKYKWTQHVKDKMLYYGISEGLIKRIVRFPKRKEEGVAPNTTAVMEPTPSKKQEIWVMFQEINQKSNLPEGVATRPYGAGKNQNDKSKFKNYQKLETSYQQPKCRIISAWRYPGISPVGKKIPIPEEILHELEKELI